VSCGTSRTHSLFKKNKLDWVKVGGAAFATRGGVGAARLAKAEQTIARQPASLDRGPASDRKPSLPRPPVRLRSAVLTSTEAHTGDASRRCRSPPAG